MHKISVYEMIALQQYFASKKKPTALDKKIAKKIDDHLIILADGMVTMSCSPITV